MRARIYRAILIVLVIAMSLGALVLAEQAKTQSDWLFIVFLIAGIIGQLFSLSYYVPEWDERQKLAKDARRYRALRAHIEPIGSEWWLEDPAALDAFADDLLDKQWREERASDLIEAPW